MVSVPMSDASATQLIEIIGDKETFWLGWELVGDTGYAFHRGGVAVMGHAESKVAEKDIPLSDAETEITSAELRRSAEPESLTTGENQKALSVSYTVCAPQLLHLAANGRPLWFNGGILENKFAEKKDRVFGNFQEYVAEPPVVTPATWQLLGNNKACLTGQPGIKHALTETEKAKVAMMVEHAKKYM